MIKEIEILLVEDSSSDAEMTTFALKKNNLANKLLHVKTVRQHWISFSQKVNMLTGK
jgi:hypothetical protein